MEPSSFLHKTEDRFLELERPIIFFDLETTGTSVTRDRIVELCAIKLHPDGTREECHHLINPSIPIPAGATAVHGITNEMVAGKPLFRELATGLADFFQHSDLGGYNIRRFDVPLLMEEFHRVKKYPVNIHEVKVVDAMAIFHSKEKRDLSAALKFYCQREHEQAHSAKADVLATIDILKQQLVRYDDLSPDTAFLHDYLASGNTIDFSGRFRRDENGEIIFNFGKHFGKAACRETSYLKWMFEEGDFAVDTKMVAKRIFMHCLWEDEIRNWLQASNILSNAATTSALYSCIKYGKDVFPFASGTTEGKPFITYVMEPPVTYFFPHTDAVSLFLQVLDRALRDMK